MKFQPSIPFLVAILSFTYLIILNAENSTAKNADQEPITETTTNTVLTSQPEATPTPGKFLKSQFAAKALVIHKPKPSPSWGKVIQYHRDQIFALTDKNREVIHEFLFQDDDGIIRTALFHENAAGDGYWEVWVWDQP